MTAAKHLILDALENELGIDVHERPDGRPIELLYTPCAEGSTPDEFFGYAIVAGMDTDGEMHKDWYVSNPRCPFREDAIAVLMQVWTETFGGIARFEVDRILEESQRSAEARLPAPSFKTTSDTRPEAVAAYVEGRE